MNAIKLLAVVAIGITSTFVIASETVKIINDDEYYKDIAQELVALPDDQPARELKDIVINKDFDQRNFNNSKLAKTEGNTYMVKTSEDVKTTFNYVSVSKTLAAVVVGAAPAGAYLDGKWTAIREFFSAKDLGACSIEIWDMTTKVGGGVVLPKSTTTFEVNGRPTVITDNKDSLDLFWASDNAHFRLDCLAKDKDKMTKMIVAAKKIDGAM